MTKRISWNKGKKCPEISGENNPMYGKKRPDVVERNKTREQRDAVIRFNKSRKHSDETKKKIGIKSREDNLRRGTWKGKNNPGWNGGKSHFRNLCSYADYQKWRKAILKRDGNSCAMCLDERSLQVHHIEPVSSHPERILDIDNGIVLCKWCHIMTHNVQQRPKGCTVW